MLYQHLQLQYETASLSYNRMIDNIGYGQRLKEIVKKEAREEEEEKDKQKMKQI